MERMSTNVESPIRYYEDGSQLTNWMLESGATCHIIPEISDFIPGRLVETDKYIEVADRNFVTAKQTVEVKIDICDYNGKPFIATLCNVLFASDLWN